VILSCFRYSINFLHRQNSTENFFLGPNRKVVADRAGTCKSYAIDLRFELIRSIIFACFYLYVSVVNLIGYSDIDKMMDINNENFFLGPNRKVVADRAGTKVRKYALCFLL
jgi:hypothetical protein